MSFKTQLFTAINEADDILLDGDLVHDTEMFLDLGKVYVELADGTSFYFLDQEIEIDGGSAWRVLSQVGGAHCFEFRISRPLQESDLE